MIYAAMFRRGVCRYAVRFGHAVGGFAGLLLVISVSVSCGLVIGLAVGAHPTR